MSPVRTHSKTTKASSAETRSAVSGAWILSTWQDLVLIIATPAFIVPVVLLLQANISRSSLEMLAILVAGFGALGHHLPGMIRAYGDPELFARFKIRFIVAPLFLLAVCIPLSQNNLSGMLLILLLWGYWHGLMQVYGFARIYDVKVGSTAAVTANLDWLMCLSWFSAGLVFSDARMAYFLDTLYTGGGPLVPQAFVHGARLLVGTVTGVISVCFLVNYVWQWRWGQRPNPNKLLMLASGIGFWWFAMVTIQNVLLGIAIFEIFHDVQYLAIVWIYNRRRVDRASGMGAVMRFLFRRSTVMISLYIALVSAYGFISIIVAAAPSEDIRKMLTGFIWASTILHFYYDGFIWKVREKTMREGLGLIGGESDARSRPFLSGELLHGLKWSPFVILLCWMSLTELTNSSPPPPGTMRRTWPSETHIKWSENIAQVVPGNLISHARLAAILDNCGRTDEAKTTLSEVLERNPTFVEGHLLLGKIHYRLGEVDQAIECFRRAIQNETRESEQVESRFLLGEAYQQQGDLRQAQREYQQVLQISPNFPPAVAALQAIERTSRTQPAGTPKIPRFTADTH